MGQTLSRNANLKTKKASPKIGMGIFATKKPYPILRTGFSTTKMLLLKTEQSFSKTKNAVPEIR